MVARSFANININRDRSILIVAIVSIVMLLSLFLFSNGMNSSCKDLNGSRTHSSVRKMKTDPAKATQARRCAFVDLGANRADTLKIFLKEENAKFSFDFPIPFWAKHDKCEIFLFEANPLFTNDLREAEKTYRAKGIKVTAFPETAVAVYDGNITLYLDEVNVDHDFWGTTIHANGGERSVSVTALDISSWLMKNFEPKDYVLVKMDIEKAEYDVMPRMLELGVDAVVDVMLVEWHGYDNSDGQVHLASAAAVTLTDSIFMPYYDSPA